MASATDSYYLKRRAVCGRSHGKPEDTMQLERLKQKYGSALEPAQKNNVRLNHLHVQNGKLFL